MACGNGCGGIRFSLIEKLVVNDSLTFSCSIRLLFQYTGWPLCVHEKIVIQLASLDWWILRPEDFYLQAVLYLRRSPWIIVKCLAKDKHNVEEFVASAALYASLFTVEWLSSLSRNGWNHIGKLLVSHRW